MCYDQTTVSTLNYFTVVLLVVAHVGLYLGNSVSEERIAFSPEDWGNKSLRNVAIHLQVHPHGV
jgi:hypothetical protein